MSARFRKIIVPLDGTRSSERALSFAKTLAATANGELVILRVDGSEAHARRPRGRQAGVRGGVLAGLWQPGWSSAPTEGSRKTSQAPSPARRPGETPIWSPYRRMPGRRWADSSWGVLLTRSCARQAYPSCSSRRARRSARANDSRTRSSRSAVQRLPRRPSGQRECWPGNAAPDSHSCGWSALGPRSFATIREPAPISSTSPASSGSTASLSRFRLATEKRLPNWPPPPTSTARTSF
jgi:Universal stress protein family